MGRTTGPRADASGEPVCAQHGRVSLADELAASAPTPLVQLNALGAEFELLWCKNDGLTGSTYGGNKLRKLAPILLAAKRKRVRRLVTFGAAGSHHVLATTLYGHAAGLRVTALYVPQLHTPHAERTFRAALAQGVEAIPLASTRGLRRTLRSILGPHDAWIGPGAIGPLGSAEYANAMLEFEQQRSTCHMPVPARIVIAVGSGSTAAGLLVGLAESPCPYAETKLVGVLSSPNPAARSSILAQAVALGRRRGLGLSPVQYARRLEIITDQHGGAYGKPTAAGEAASARAAIAGLVLDPTYTAKAFAASLRLLGQRREVTLYWHTLSATPLEPLLQGAPTTEQLPDDLRRLLTTNSDLRSPEAPQAR